MPLWLRPKASHRYEGSGGNTADKTTLGRFLQKIEAQYGKADRIWVMDREFPPKKCWPKCERVIHRFGYLLEHPEHTE